jgi:L-ascorbate metabolism protein UlaG (beta-lactamase superfamily)
MASLRRIPTDVPLIAPQGTGAYLRTRLPHTVHTIDVWEQIHVGSVEVIAVPASHNGLGPALSPLSTSAGFIIRGSVTIYFAGDTALFAEMEELGDTFDIDLALLPVWGYGPNLRGDHMTPRDAAHALTLLRPRRAIPIHWGTFRPVGKLWSRLSYFSDPPYTFAGYAAYLAPETEVHILQPGETLAL